MRASTRLARPHKGAGGSILRGQIQKARVISKPRERSFL